MKRHLKLLIATAVTWAVAQTADADWVFQPSTYSHDPATCSRVDQYAAKKVSYARTDPTYMESGYVHKRTVLRGADGSVTRRHVVRTWGAGEDIRPYGEWQRPYRAGATPYGPWGNSQGPWTTPFESWDNPYGQWNRYPYLPWGFGYGYGGGQYGGGQPGYGPPIATPYPNNGPYGYGYGEMHGGARGPSRGPGYPAPNGSPGGHHGSSPHAAAAPHGTGGPGGGHP
ncbi:MAG TPA: hypothetical protein VE890_03935 [Thermoguttaceae bacterium]|nr:hypothetical protein [Thermoguttaceae bacterium]